MIKKLVLFIIFFFPFFSWIGPVNASENCISWTICSPDFKISVGNISPWMRVHWSTAEKSANYVLWTIIQRLMVGLWSVSLLIMTVWAWYMILYTWQDELLTKWKSIFMSWIISLVVALSSYYIVTLLRFILYND